MNVRKQKLAGKFYPKTEKEIILNFEQTLKEEKENIAYQLAKHTIIGGIVPHAGHIYSSRQAIHFFEILAHSGQSFHTVIILNPNHTGYGDDVSLDEHNFWETPLGKLEIDNDFADLLPFRKNKAAHDFEHSSEVLLPYLQYFYKQKIKILPITILKQNTETAKAIASEIIKVKNELHKKILILASSDFSHFETPEKGYKKDQKIIDAILSKDMNGVYQNIKRHNVTVCGYAPIMILMEFARASGEYQLELLARGHSGQVHPSNEVVNYISFLAYKKQKL